MDSDLEKHYLNRSLHTDAEISDMRDKKYYHYRGKLMDFKDLFQNGINDVTFEVIFEKLMNSSKHFENAMELSRDQFSNLITLEAGFLNISSLNCSILFLFPITKLVILSSFLL